MLRSPYRLCLFGLLSISVGACVTVGPASEVEIWSRTATAMHWTYETSLYDLNAQQRQARVRSYQPQPVTLPRRVRARIGDDLWIAPVCGNRVRWDAAAVYQVPGSARIEVVCPS